MSKECKHNFHPRYDRHIAIAEKAIAHWCKLSNTWAWTGNEEKQQYNTLIENNIPKYLGDICMKCGKFVSPKEGGEK